MKTWDLSGGAARLQESLDLLNAAWIETTTQWDDPANQQFLKDHLAPLHPKARIALNAIQRITEVLGQAERECSDD